jgi:hypothetical protein
MSVARPGIIAPAGLAALTLALASCGGNEKGASKHAPGSSQNPLVAAAPDAKARQAASKTGHFNEAHPDPAAAQRASAAALAPCGLVTAGEARTILGREIRKPVQAPQGPTCIYRTRAGKSFVTVAVQPLDRAKLEPQLKRTQPTKVSGRKAYCGYSGQSTLYVPLSGERLLVVGGACGVARAFAAKAIVQLAR